VEIFAEFEEALEGLDGYSHLFIISYLRRLRPDQIGPPKVKPKRATRRDFKLEELPMLGVIFISEPERVLFPFAFCLFKLHLNHRVIITPNPTDLQNRTIMCLF
jgi:tRNA (Thr-GGU) A37 N-methylase